MRGLGYRIAHDDWGGYPGDSFANLEPDIVKSIALSSKHRLGRTNKLLSSSPRAVQLDMSVILRGHRTLEERDTLLECIVIC